MSMALKVKKEGFYSKPRKSPRHAYIDPNARGTGYIILYAYHIYTAVRHQTPYRGQGLWSRVYGIPGLGSHKVTRSTISPGSHGYLGYHGSFISPICLTHGLRVTRPPSPATSHQPTNHPGHRVTKPPRSQITRPPRHPGHQGHQTPGSPSLGSPGSQGHQTHHHPNTRVTIHPDHPSPLPSSGSRVKPRVKPMDRVKPLDHGLQTQHQLPGAHIWVFGSGTDHNAILKIIELQAPALTHDRDCCII